MPTYTSGHLTKQDVYHCHYSRKYIYNMKTIKMANMIHMNCKTGRCAKNNLDCRKQIPQQHEQEALTKHTATKKGKTNKHAIGVLGSLEKEKEALFSKT